MATQVPKDLELPTGNGELILVVDDEATPFVKLPRQRWKHNYKVLTASDRGSCTVCAAPRRNQYSVD